MLRESLTVGIRSGIRLLAADWQDHQVRTELQREECYVRGSRSCRRGGDHRGHKAAPRRQAEMGLGVAQHHRLVAMEQFSREVQSQLELLRQLVEGLQPHGEGGIRSSARRPGS